MFFRVFSTDSCRACIDSFLRINYLQLVLCLFGEEGTQDMEVRTVLSQQYPEKLNFLRRPHL